MKEPNLGLVLSGDFAKQQMTLIAIAAIVLK